MARMENATRFPASVQRLWCGVMGHRIDHLGERRVASTHPTCLCGKVILGTGLTHIGHVFGCAVNGHRLTRLRRRAHGDEYVCQRCAHPILLPTRGPAVTQKAIDWACGMRGHRVVAVGSWKGFVEHACGCGHPFLLEGRNTVVRHPAACVLAGHMVEQVGRRGRHAVYRCNRCGHPFYFNRVAAARHKSPSRPGTTL